MNRKGQAALEFLSTYGFAFLIILVMVGALAYFGVLNPTQFLPDRCLLGTELNCDDWQITNDIGASNDFTVNIVAQNNLGQSIQIIGGEEPEAEMPQFGAAGAPTTCTVDQIAGAAAGAAPWTIPSGANFQIACTWAGAGTGLPQPDEKVKVDLEFTWREIGGAFPHITQGEVFTTVQ